MPAGYERATGSESIVRSYHAIRTNHQSGCCCFKRISDIGGAD